MSVRFFCRRPWAPKFCLQESPGQVSKAPCAQRLVARSFAAAGVPVTKEPTGLSRTYGKRPDGLTLVPWQSGKSLYWDVTVICPLAESYVNGAARQAGAAAEVAASRQDEKYAELDSRYLFRPIAVEILGVFNSSANSLLKEIGLRISTNTGSLPRPVSYTSAYNC